MDTTVIDGYVDIKEIDGEYVFTWRGGDLTLVTPSLLDNAKPGIFTWSARPERVGQRFTCGPYSLEVVEVRPGGVLLVKRMFW